MTDETGKKKPADQEDAAAANNLRRIFGRLAFEKGQAYADSPKAEGEEDLMEEQLAAPTRRRRRRKPVKDVDERPPEAYPGP